MKHLKALTLVSKLSENCLVALGFLITVAICLPQGYCLGTSVGSGGPGGPDK